MTAREALRELVERLSDEEVEALWARLLEERARHGRSGQPVPAFIDSRQYPALEAVWDNEDDAIFDELYAR